MYRFSREQGAYNSAKKMNLSVEKKIVVLKLFFLYEVYPKKVFISDANFFLGFKIVV